MINHIIKTAIFLFFFTALCIAQQDSLFIDTETENDTLNDTTFVMEKSPWKAILLSAIVPGLGQIYNESYLKAPIIWGIEGLLAAGWIFNHERYKDNRTLFNRTQIEDYRRIRDFYRDQRDLFTIYISLVYILNLVDAYVDAHLFDFTVEEDFFTRMPMLGFRLNF